MCVEVTMKNQYKSVMDAEANPLKDLPRVRRYKIMLLLGAMWTVAFCAAFGAWIWFGHLLLAHFILAGCFLITGTTFHQAKVVTTYRDHPRKDGTARYDDVWGG